MEITEQRLSKSSTKNPQGKLYDPVVVKNSSEVLECKIAELQKVTYGRMVPGKSMNKVGVKKLFELVLQNNESVEVEAYTEDIVIITFGTDAGKRRILRGKPWHYAGSYLILVKFDAMTQVTTKKLQHIPFWVQVKRIPPGFLVKPVGEKLGMEIANSMGEFLEFDPNYRRSFMRFRVGMDPTGPLPKGKFIKINKNKDKIWISYRYDRLTKYCYFCGKLNHMPKDCVELIEELESGNNPSMQYNDSLKTAALGHFILREGKVIHHQAKKLNQNPTVKETHRTCSMVEKQILRPSA